MEIKYKPRPLTYIKQKYVRIVGPFYFRDRNWKINTPERHLVRPVRLNINNNKAKDHTQVK